MPTIVSLSDLAPFADIDPVKAQAMIDDAMADASRVAPCINDADLTLVKIAQFRSVIRAAILRWHDAGSGAISAQTAGPFGQTLDTRVQRRGMYWPGEVESLQDICKGDTDMSGAYTIDTAPGYYLGMHGLICALNFGALYCSCGFDIAGEPIFEP